MYSTDGQMAEMTKSAKMVQNVKSGQNGKTGSPKPGLSISALTRQIRFLCKWGTFSDRFPGGICYVWLGHMPRTSKLRRYRCGVCDIAEHQSGNNVSSNTTTTSATCNNKVDRRNKENRKNCDFPHLLCGDFANFGNFGQFAPTC